MAEGVGGVKLGPIWFSFIFFLRVSPMKTWLLRPLGQGLVLAMGSHHPLVAPLVPDKSYLILFRKNLLVKNKNNLAFHPGPVSPPGGDGSPLYWWLYPKASSALSITLSRSLLPGDVFPSFPCHS